jgi:hypothetical protein
MEFHSEWLLDDPVEVLSALNKAGFSKDELDKLATKENLAGVEKALLLLDSGQIAQKLWVARTLSTVMHEPRFEAVVVELLVSSIQNRLPYWNEASQEEAGRGLQKVIAAGRFPEQYNEHLLNLALQIIDCETWTLQTAWAEVLGELTRGMTDKLLTRCTQEVLTLAAFNQPDQNKAAAGLVLGHLIEARKKPPGEITRKLLSMCQDPSNFVRQHMCRPLRVLFKLSKEYEERALNEIIKLVGDECETVLEESLQLFVDVLPEVIDKEYVKKNVMACFVGCRLDKLTEVKVRFVGRVMRGLKSVLDEREKEEWTAWVVEMAEIGGLKEKIAASTSFGGVVDCAGVSDRLIGLWNLLEGLGETVILQNLYAQIAFVAAQARGKTKEIQGIVRKALNHHEFMELLVPQFAIIAKNADMQEELIADLIGKLDGKMKLREMVAVVEQICRFLLEFNCVSAVKGIISKLISLAKTAAKPVKGKVLELLAIVVYKSPGYSSKISLSQEIISNFANSNISYERISYIHFCLCIKNLCSRRFFSRVFMSNLIILAKDREKSVKYHFATNYPTFRYLIPLTDNELGPRFRNILNEWLETDDKILVGFALAADEELNNSRAHDLNYGPSSESIENARVKHEEEEETKELVELEKLQKAQNEEVFFSSKRYNRKHPANNKEPVPRQGSVKPIKKLSMTDPDRLDKALSRSIFRAGKKK